MVDAFESNDEKKINIVNTIQDKIDEQSSRQEELKIDESNENKESSISNKYISKYDELFIELDNQNLNE